jgi:cytochrome c peroxidase
MAARIPRAPGIGPCALALWLVAGLGCAKGAKGAASPSVADLVLAPRSAALYDGGGAVPVAFSVDVSDPDADVARLVITLLDGSGVPTWQLDESVPGLSGVATRRVGGMIPVPTSAIGPHAIQVRAIDAGGRGSNVVQASFDVVQGSVLPLTCRSPGTGFREPAPAPTPGGAVGFVPLVSLKTVANPVIPRDALTDAPLLRPDLAGYVADLAAAIQLGKALFWDVQAGSDDATACATCHHHAGADSRRTSQLNPGANGLWDRDGTAERGPGYTLTAADFPFTDPAAARDTDDVVGSQGVRSSAFGGIGATGAELTTPLDDPTFGAFRRVTRLHSPTAINAVFNSRNFFDGRADSGFNGVSPFGDRDRAAHVWTVLDAAGNVGQVDVRLATASLASQAVGPPLNAVEMSAAGRTFPELGKKLLLLQPLGRQRVSPADGVLGSLAVPSGKGLATSYAALIQRAFQPQWWDTPRTVALDSGGYSLMQANFSLFWGLSIMLYEATLVADDSPMDRYVASRLFDAATGALVGDPALLDPVVERLAREGIALPLPGGGERRITRGDILAGLDLFEKPPPPPGEAGLPPGTGVGCSLCHAGAETTSASVGRVTTGIDASSMELAAAGFDLRIERMFMGVRAPAQLPPRMPPPVPAGTDRLLFDAANGAIRVVGIDGGAVAPQPVTVATYDTGWYNIGVRPTADHPGAGGVDPFGQPLSFTELYLGSGASRSIVLAPGRGLGCVMADGTPLTPPAAPAASPFAGEVLAPGTSFPLLSGALRPNEPTAVAGSFKTSSLRNVEVNGPYLHTGGKATLLQVMELYDGGGDFANATLPPLIRPLALSADQLAALVAFLVSLTDERVLYERAPFDHPELPLPAGRNAAGDDIITMLPAVGAAGASTPLRRFLDLSPFDP